MGLKFEQKLSKIFLIYCNFFSIKDEIQFENQCDYINATIVEYNDWLNGNLIKLDSEFKKFDKKHFWAYCDYKYMNDLVEKKIIDESVI